MKFRLTIVISLWVSFLYGQTSLTIHGVIRDRQNDEPVELVSVIAHDNSLVTNSDTLGLYQLLIPSGKESIIQFRRTGYKQLDYTLPPLSPGSRFELNVDLVPITSDLEVIVTAERIENAGMVREKVEAMKLLPSTTGNLESVLPHIALGASSGTGGELTSQYNVRGGNYLCSSEWHSNSSV